MMLFVILGIEESRVERSCCITCLKLVTLARKCQNQAENTDLLALNLGFLQNSTINVLWGFFSPPEEKVYGIHKGNLDLSSP